MSPTSFLKRQFGDSALFAELYVRAQQRFQRSKRPRLVIFADAIHSGSGGYLRGRALAPHLRALGWRVIVVPPTADLELRRRIVSVEQPDVILIRQSRHPLNRPSYYAPVPCVFDADDADIHYKPKEVEECLKGSVAAIAGSRYVAKLFSEWNDNVTVIWTGTNARPPRRALPNERRGPVLTWAHSVPAMFPMECEFLRDVLTRLAVSHRFDFHFYGYRADEDSQLRILLDPLRAAGVAVKNFPPLPYQPFIESLGSVAIGLNPVCMEHPLSRGKSFGKVLAYMTAGAAVVTSPELDHPLFFENGRNAMLATTVDEWVRCCGYLLDHPQERAGMTRQARQDAAARLTSMRSAELVSEFLHRVLTKSGVGRERSSEAGVSAERS